jgi:hypothetical protein
MSINSKVVENGELVSDICYICGVDAEIDNMGCVGEYCGVCKDCCTCWDCVFDRRGEDTESEEEPEEETDEEIEEQSDGETDKETNEDN